MLSTIPKLADKSFIIGYLFPIIVFLLSLFFLFHDLLFFSTINDIILSDRKFEKLLYSTLVVWGFAIVLLTLNQTLFQLVEGYIWPIPQLMRFMGSPELRRFRKKSKQLEDLKQEWRTAIAVGLKFPDASEREHDELSMQLVTQFPSEERLILATRFGNAIRAFEDYSRNVFGADSIPLSIHLNIVMSKEFKESVEDARVHVTFALNMFILSTISSFCGILVVVYRVLTHENIGIWISYSLFTILTALFAWLMYELSINRAYSWGSLVKAAFDCYLPELASKLGYILPLTGEEQRHFWVAVSRRAIYHRKFKPEDWARSKNLEQMDTKPKQIQSSETENVESGTEVSSYETEEDKNK